jgi:hypothetical protein
MSSLTKNPLYTTKIAPKAIERVRQPEEGIKNPQINQ